MKVSFLQLDIGGVINHEMVDVPSDGARWDASSVSAVIATAEGGSSVTLSVTEGPATVLATSAAVGARQITVTSASDFQRERRYTIGPNQQGQHEVFTCDGADQITKIIKLNSPLLYAYSSGNAVKSHELFAVVAATTVASEGDYLAVWSYDVDGYGRNEYTTVKATRYFPRIPLSAAELLENEPRARAMVGSNQRVDIVLKWIWQHTVLADLAQMWEPGSQISGEDLETALVYAFFEYANRLAGKDEVAENWEKKYQDELDKLQKTLVDTNADGVVDDDDQKRSAYTPRLIRG